MTTFFILGLVLALAVIAYFHQFVIQQILCLLCPIRDTRGRSIPGPRFNSLDGHLLDKFAFGRKNSRKWRPLGVYRLWAGWRPEVVISNPEDIRHFYSDSSRHVKAPACNAGWIFNGLLGQCLGMINGQDWHQSRKIFDSGMSGKGINQNLIDSTTKDYVESLRSSLPNQDWTFRAADSLMRYQFFLSAEAIYGKLFPEEKEELWQLGQEHIPLFMLILQGTKYRTGLMKWSTAQALRSLTIFQRKWKRFNDKMFAKSHEQSVQTPFVAYREGIEKGETTEAVMLQTIDEMLFANLDVSTHVLTWLITLLGKSEVEQFRLHEELHQRAADPGYLSDENSHLHRCLLESMRMRPITIFSIPEASPEVKQFGGYIVPPYTDVIVDTLCLNVDNPFWGPDGEVFRPARFGSLKPSDLRYNFFAFGCGHRKCLGQHFAKYAVKCLTKEIFSQFKVEVLRDGSKTQEDSSENVGGWVPLSDVKLRLSEIRYHANYKADAVPSII